MYDELLYNCDNRHVHLFAISLLGSFGIFAACRDLHTVFGYSKRSPSLGDFLPMGFSVQQTVAWKYVYNFFTTL